MRIIKIKYRILQLNHNRESAINKLFMPWDILTKYCGGFDITDYKEVYASELQTDIKETNVILDHLFEKFNLNHPEDFHGHSLSVSDVVVLGNEIYFCDSLCWKKVS